MILDLELHEDVRYQLKKRGVTLSQIARELGKSPSTITAVSQGRVKSHMVQEAICRHLGKSHPSEIWPDRYPVRLDNEEGQKM
ncbi:helix-turn-helix domain-containing protein [Pelagimonas phthalicica]|uniref:helix-turn-helix domain-containing protein n=1 Tax=Pelagimonas phthalicica TaxID=1037362 RepID=UPI000C084266|nr:Nlp family transcriptional regulator [Pelagimonas phthalicica]